MSMRSAISLTLPQQGRHRGQTLLVAVLLMMAILLVGILFVSVVVYNQGQTTRSTDTAAAQALADAGVRLADTMLQQSALGADWRPPFKPAVGTENVSDPSTWAVPPAEYVDANGNVTGYDVGFWGPDLAQGTDDDYYTQDEIDHGLCPQRLGTPAAPGDFVRYGFTRYPDVVSRGNTTPTLLDNEYMGRGHVLLRVSYSPLPVVPTGGTVPTTVDTNAKYIKIESEGHLDEGPTVWRKLTAYKPIGLTENLMFVTDKVHSGRAAVLGIAPWISMVNWVDPITGQRLLSVDRTSAPSAVPISQRGDFIVSGFHGPIKSNIPITMEGDTLSTSATPTADYSSLQISLTTAPAVSDTDMTSGYPRSDTLEVSGGISERLPYSGAVTVNDGTPSRITPSTLSSGFDTVNGVVHDGVNGLDAQGNSRFAKQLNAPDIFTGNAVSGADRYHALTRDSGRPTLNPTTNTYVNSGSYGYGAGIYVDNTADVQFATYDPNTGASTHDLTALMDDWMRNLSPRDPRAGDSGWNATYTTYAPRAVEIEFFPTEVATLGYGTYTADTAATPTSPDATGTLWWPHHQAGQPGIKITRHDKRWQVGDPNPPSGNFGDDSGRNVMVVDYPQNGVIYAEGNIRVKGELPSRRKLTTPFATWRDDGFSTTVVSGATIYIDGQLLSPQDRWTRKAQDDGNYDPAGGVTDEDTPKVALLANDCVCLNPTQIVPQITAGMASAAADDTTNPSPSDQHWVLSPGSQGQIYTRFAFGKSVPAGSTIQVVARQMGADPGPAAISMNVGQINKSGSATDPTTWAYQAMAPYPFGTDASGNIYNFIFAPYGALLPTSGAVPNAWSAPWLSPQWPSASQYLANTWNIPIQSGSSMISTSPGDVNVLSLVYSDPRMSMGAADYWLKCFKVQEYDSIGTGSSATSCPAGTIYAKVRAIVYAQTGCWFVIPGAYFDPTTTSSDTNGDGIISGGEAMNVAASRRYNYAISVVGAITENFTAPPDSVRDWTDKWAYPVFFNGSGGNGPALGWGTISYYYDETLSAARDQAPTVLSSSNTRYATTLRATNWANLPKAPCLPVSPDLIYYGE